ncbi:uncharacterized protein LOC105383543 [Plutella xylostella]|uniref:uncharacterized protein LOC105383543 n=1 Tax=Plutella xylostella TaxID=51655 RepID=UPI002032D8FD|nr:uncharacterized protein LOC105383543 [Plutella xylostella]
MLSKFHQQAVMAGSVDYFCLACDDVIRSAAAAARHVRKPVHGKNLSGTGYVSVGGSERIRKVKKGYYCEFCNILVATITKTNSHIKEETHLFNKSHPSAAEAVKESAFLRRVKTTVVAFDDIAIADLAWEGIIENSCVVCDVEVDNANIHKSKVEHTLNVIKAKLQIGPDNISRKIDDSTYQCLTCNTIVAAEDIIPHFDQPEHSRLYLERRKAKRALIKKTDADSRQTTTTISDAVNAESEKKNDKHNATKDTKLNAETVNNNEKHKAIAKITKKETDETAKLPTSSQNRTMIIESIEGFHKENILIDLIGDKAFCRVCAKNVSFAFDAIVIHIEEHRQQNRAGPSTSAKTSAQPSKADDTSAIQVAENPDEKKAKQEFGKDNVIRFESDGSTFCLLCKMKVSSSLELLKKHVEGHKTGMPTVQYIEKFIIFKVPERHGVIINNQICLEYRSFLFLRQMDREGVLRCVACQVNVYKHRVEEHRETHRHRRIMEDTPVLTTTSATSEFIRKVRPDTYHCGFCNQLEIGLASLSDHLQSSSHQEQKELSTRILHDVLMVENLRAARDRRLMNALASMNLFGMYSDIWDSD